MVAFWETERNVRHTQNRVRAQGIANIVQRVQRDIGILRTRADGKCERIKNQVFLFNPVFRRRFQNAFGNLDSALCRFGNAVFIERQAHNRAAVFFGKREHGFH